MLDKFVPDMHYQSIYRIDYEKLKNKGIKLIIFDLDNTISPVNESMPPKEAILLMYKLKEMGLIPVLMSNSHKKRVYNFRNSLEIDACASSKKPLSKNYKKIMKVYNVTADKVACIGDQLLTDILGANKLNMVSILVNPMSKKDSKFTVFNRFIEKILFKIMEKQDIFKRGNYYE